MASASSSPCAKASRGGFAGRPPPAKRGPRLSPHTALGVVQRALEPAPDGVECPRQGRPGQRQGQALERPECRHPHRRRRCPRQQQPREGLGDSVGAAGNEEGLERRRRRELAEAPEEPDEELLLLLLGS